MRYVASIQKATVVHSRPVRIRLRCFITNNRILRSGKEFRTTSRLPAQNRSDSFTEGVKFGMISFFYDQTVQVSAEEIERL